MHALVLGDSQELALKIREILLRGAIQCPSTEVVGLDQADSLVHQSRPELVVLVLSPDAERTIGLLREIRRDTQAHVIAVGPAEDAKLVLRTLREGANEYLDQAELDSELTASLERLKSQGMVASKRGRLFALLSSSGGCGSSTLAVNLATALAKKHEHALLLDLKLGVGDLPSLLDLKPVHSLADLCKNLQRLDRSMFEQVLVQHSSGVQLLAAPTTQADCSQVTAKGVWHALTIAATMFPYIVADLDHSFHEEQTLVLKNADVVLVILRLEVACVRNAGRTLDSLDRIGVSADRIRLVVNRFGQSKELPLASAEQALGMKVHHSIPDDPKTILRANNSGIPAVLQRPWVGVSRRMTEIATSLNGTT